MQHHISFIEVLVKDRQTELRKFAGFQSARGSPEARRHLDRRLRSGVLAVDYEPVVINKGEEPWVE